MKRRNFLVGVGGTAVGGSALIGSGAFSRVESDRAVSIEVAKDPDAYLGLDRCDSKNSKNYAHLDENGHGYLEITDSGNGGEGVNSNSTTEFDDIFQVCNQGKADMTFHIDASEMDVRDGGVVEFYRNDAVIGSSEHNEPEPIDIDLGECVCIGVRTKTHGVDATVDEPLVDDQKVTLVANAPGAGGE